MKKNIMSIIVLMMFFFCISLPAITIIGHRGACGYKPENTLSSFAQAIACHVDMIEFDVWKCLSGELVVFHDSCVDRLTDGTGLVELKTLDELKRLTVLGCEQIPTLTEVIDFINRRATLYIELKGSNTVLDVVALIEHYVTIKQWDYTDFLVGSFNHCLVQEVKKINNAIPIAVLLSGIPVNLGAFASDSKAQIAVVDAECITQRFVDDIHERGVLVYVFTINSKEDLMRVVSYGVDGIITDYPDYISTSLSV